MNEKVKQAIEIVIEEYANVDEAFQNIKNIKVGSMTLNDLFGDNLKVIEKALEERKELLKWKDSQQDLIKGKDEYIAKLLDESKKLKGWNKYYVEQLNDCKEELKQAHKETENEQFANNKNEQETNDLREFAKIVSRKFEHYFQEFKQSDIDQYVINETYFVKGKDKEFDLIKKVVEKYGKKED